MKQILLTSIAVAFAMLASAQERVIKMPTPPSQENYSEFSLKNEGFGGLLMLVCLHL